MQPPAWEEIDGGRRVRCHRAVWSIGLAGFGSLLHDLYLAKNNLGNVPDRVVSTDVVKTPFNALPMTLYYT